MSKMESVFAESCRVLKEKGFFQFSILHPCATTKQRQWIEDESGQKKGLVIGDYFDANEPIVGEWYFSATPIEERGEPFRVPYFHRTISHYFNTLRSVGFVVEAIDEPFASNETIEECRLVANVRIVPHFLIFRCVKTQLS